MLRDVASSASWRRKGYSACLACTTLPAGTEPAIRERRIDTMDSQIPDAIHLGADAADRVAERMAAVDARFDARSPRSGAARRSTRGGAPCAGASHYGAAAAPIGRRDRIALTLRQEVDLVMAPSATQTSRTSKEALRGARLANTCCTGSTRPWRVQSLPT